MPSDELAKIINISNSSIDHNIKNVLKELKIFDIALLNISGKGLHLDVDNNQR